MYAEDTVGAKADEFSALLGVFWFNRYFLNTFFLDRTAFLRVRLTTLQIIEISEKIVKQLLETLYRKKTDLVSDQTYQEL